MIVNEDWLAELERAGRRVHYILYICSHGFDIQCHDVTGCSRTVAWKQSQMVSNASASRSDLRRATPTSRQDSQTEKTTTLRLPYGQNGKSAISALTYLDFAVVRVA